jgi:hypothetical protein
MSPARVDAADSSGLWWSPSPRSRGQARPGIQTTVMEGKMRAFDDSAGG